MVSAVDKKFLVFQGLPSLSLTLSILQLTAQQSKTRNLVLLIFALLFPPFPF